MSNASIVSNATPFPSAKIPNFRIRFTIAILLKSHDTVDYYMRISDMMWPIQVKNFNLSDINLHNLMLLIFRLQITTVDRIATLTDSNGKSKV